MKSNSQATKIGLLKDEISAVNLLLTTLQEEFDTLNNQASPEKILNLAARKEVMLTTIEALSNNRIALLPISDPELLTEPLNALWKNLLEAAAACQKQNQINGAIINTTKRYAEQATIILNGIQPATELHYDSSGETISGRQPRTLAKA